MKTDKLIDMLGTNVEPVKGGQLRNTLLFGLVVGVAAALCLTLALFGTPVGIFGAEDLGVRMLTLTFTLGLAIAGVSFLIKAARPGKPVRKPLVLIGILFTVILLGGIVALAFAHPVAWGGMVFGPEWAACLLCIPLFAIAPFLSLVWALRKEAPTNLRLTGAVTGLVAGALGAAVYALDHSASSVPFIVLWYGGAIVACTAVGALLGPRLLRW